MSEWQIFLVLAILISPVVLSPFQGEHFIFGPDYNDTVTEPSAKVNNNGTGDGNTTKLAYFKEHCGLHKANRETDCDRKSNLVCEDPIPNIYSRCECIPNTHPHPAGLPICVYSVKVLEIGARCNPNATEDEEVCEGELSLCENGICACADDSDGQIQFDKEHKDCYLKINPRHGEGTDNGAMSSAKMDLKLGLVTFIVYSVRLMA